MTKTRCAMATKKQTDIALRCLMQDIHEKGVDIHGLIYDLGCKMNTAKIDYSDHVSAFELLRSIADQITPLKPSYNTHVQPIEHF